MKTAFFALLLAACTSTAIAQVSEDSDLFKALKRMDDIIFVGSFNQCNHGPMIELISDDFEFYHDTAGLEASKSNFIATVKQNLCGDMVRKPIRKLVPGSLQVFPLYENGALYGAVQKGEHNFFIREEGKPLRATSSARFTHLWMLEEGDWKLKRVLSYDHQDPAKN